MTKSESRECLKLQAWSKFSDIDVGLLARSYSALIRSARTVKSRNEILTYAASVPAVLQHHDFIIG
jgi:hypothetical protein